MRILFLTSPIIAVGLLLLSPAEPVEASFKIRVSDGITSTTVADNSAGDRDISVFGSRVDGVLSVAKYYGWGNISFTTGITKPALGNANEPVIHLSAWRLSVSQPMPNPLSIEVTDTDFTGAPGGLDPAFFTSSIGGVTSGTVEFATFADSSNQEFGQGTALGSGYTFTNPGTGAASFNHNWSTDANVVAPFSITMRALITHDSPGATSFDAELQAVPEPISLLAWLAVLPIIGLAYWQRQRTIALTA